MQIANMQSVIQCSWAPRNIISSMHHEFKHAHFISASKSSHKCFAFSFFLEIFRHTHTRQRERERDHMEGRHVQSEVWNSGHPPKVRHNFYQVR